MWKKSQTQRHQQSSPQHTQRQCFPHRRPHLSQPQPLLPNQEHCRLRIWAFLYNHFQNLQPSRFNFSSNPPFKNLAMYEINKAKENQTLSKIGEEVAATEADRGIIDPETTGTTVSATSSLQTMYQVGGDSHQRSVYSS